MVEGRKGRGVDGSGLGGGLEGIADGREGRFLCEGGGGGGVDGGVGGVCEGGGRLAGEVATGRRLRVLRRERVGAGVEVRPVGAFGQRNGRDRSRRRLLPTAHPATPKPMAERCVRCCPSERDGRRVEVLLVKVCVVLSFSLCIHKQSTHQE